MASPRLRDKVAIVTGSSSGIGRAICLQYAREGAKIVCADLSPSARLAVAEERENTHTVIANAGGNAVFVQTDVGDAEQMRELVSKAVAEYGRLDM